MLERMKLMRLETVLDEDCGLYYLEFYLPEDATEPSFRSARLYPTPEEAESGALKSIRRALETIN